MQCSLDAPQELFTLPHCFCKCLSCLLALCFKGGKACSLEENSLCCWFLMQLTCNSWVLSSLGKESTKTCNRVEV